MTSWSGEGIAFATHGTSWSGEGSLFATNRFFGHIMEKNDEIPKVQKTRGFYDFNMVLI